MEIKLKEITIRDLVAGYKNDDDEGVVGYNGQLDIRPQYQREFIYPPKDRDAVINTIKCNFPLNTMYWVNKDDGGFEVLDGQQRTISICEYVIGHFSIDDIYFSNPIVDQEQFLDYKLTVYFCEGEYGEKIDWFQTINIAGKILTEQELRNAVFSGPWLSAAKKYFSKPNCGAQRLGKLYLTGAVNRQLYLETALKWISEGKIKAYMSDHQHDQNADELKTYFKNVIDWVKETFPKYRKEMKGCDFGSLYDVYKDKDSHRTPDELEAEISTLMKDDRVIDRKHIFAYVLTRTDSDARKDAEKLLNIRGFNDNQKGVMYEKQDGICPLCDKHFEPDDMHGDHKMPWSKGGKTELDNCQMLCVSCNIKKSNKL